MGSSCSCIKGPTEARVLMLGLTEAGKTTILYKLKLGEDLHTIPTIGFNVETVQYKGTELTVWDVGGQENIRPLWRHYYKNNQTIIFVVDSEDREQLETAKAELWNILDHEDTKGADILVFANKQDRPCALSCIELTDKLGLPKITDRSWNMQSCSAVTGKGLYEGMDWIVEQLEKK